MATTSLRNHTELHLSSGVSWPLPRIGELILGRETNVDVPLFGSETSRRHARVSIDHDGCVFVEDLGSSNGTFIAGKALKKWQAREWKPGVEVRFGPAGKGTHDVGQLVVGIRPQHAFLVEKIQLLHSSRHDSVEVTFLDEQSGEEIERAHRFVVELQSPVIKAMLSSVTQEGQTRAVKVQTNFQSVWPVVICFMYGYEYFSIFAEHYDEKDIESVVKLREAANYYQIAELAEATSQHMRLMFAKTGTLSWFRAVMERLSFDEPLVQFALQALDSRINTIFTSSDNCKQDILNKCSMGTVVEILSRDALECSEFELFNAAKEWATCNCPQDGIPQELLNVIRFEHMPKAELFAIKQDIPADIYTHALEQILELGERGSRMKRTGSIALLPTPRATKLLKSF